jgi:hypothetical protein
VTEVQQIVKALKHRAAGMAEEAVRRGRPGLKQQAEEISHLLEMLEVRLTTEQEEKLGKDTYRSGLPRRDDS